MESRQNGRKPSAVLVRITRSQYPSLVGSDFLKNNYFCLLGLLLYDRVTAHVTPLFHKTVILF